MWTANRLRSSLRSFSTRASPLDISFEDHVAAFRHKSNWEIARALAILRLCSVRSFTDNGLRLLHWAQGLGLRALLKPTIYEQFVGGETLAELQGCMKRVSQSGIRSMLAVTLEEDIGEKRSEDVYNGNCQRIVEAIQMSEGPSPMFQLKLSGLLPADLLVRLGNLYAETEKLKLVEAVAEGLAGNRIKMVAPLADYLEDKEKATLERAVSRLKEIALEAARRDVIVLVDAEYTYLNKGMSLLALAAAAAFNGDTPRIWNTYQCYLKDAYQKTSEELQLLVERLGVHFGAKVVRGAYMLRERSWAVELRLEDPVCPDYGATCRNYDSVVDYLLKKTSDVGAKCQFIAATHNENSVNFIIKRIDELAVDRRFVSFGQLYGMCDQVSYPLAEAGFAVYKSIPYGNMEEVLPYLARRAFENRSVLEGARKENDLLSKELKRRLRKTMRW